MYDLTRFSLRELTRCGAAIRSLADGAETMEQAAERIVRYLFESLGDPESQRPACVLVRFFKTHPFDQLPVELRQFAQGTLGDLPADPMMRCLTLLASAGTEPEWNSRDGSKGHQAIPLPSPEAVRRIPMIARMIHQFGVELEKVLVSSPELLLESGHTMYNIFHVEEALGSEYVPAQDFVQRHGVRSALGFGGQLPSGELFAVILFSRVVISRETAEMFRPLSLNALLTVLPFERAVFFPQREPPKRQIQQLRKERDVLQNLLEVHEQAVLLQADQLEATMRELRERNQDLARSNGDLEQFAYVASHDLQEPLRMVASYTQLLGRRYAGKLDQDADQFIHFAVDGATRMQTLINDLLLYSRVGRKEKSFAGVDCEQVMDRAVANLQSAIQESGSQIQRDPLPVVQGDELQLQQLFQNLLSNAIKYRNPDEPPRVYVQAIQQGSLWEFAVRDNGIGIAPRHHDRIFQIFQRLHTRQESSGTGIGLAICRKIVERHGGRIWVESEVGEGSTFRFTLPASRSVP